METGTQWRVTEHDTGNTREKVMRRFVLVAVLLALYGFTSAHAEVIELEGTIKTIDPDARAIAITRKTPKGEKLLKLEVAKNAGDISGFKEGDKISFAYNPDVDIISKIEKGVSEAAAVDLKAMQGVWKVTAEHEFGRVLSKEEMRKRNRHLFIKGNNLSTDRVIQDKLGTYSGSIQIVPEKKTFDFAGKSPGDKPVEWIGIYKVDGDSMTLCYRVKGEGQTPRPTEFKSLSDKPGTILFECKKEE